MSDSNLNYISLSDAAKYSELYSQEYLSLRARQGKLKAVKFGRNWVTTKQWVDDYIHTEKNVKANGVIHEEIKKENLVFEKSIFEKPKIKIQQASFVEQKNNFVFPKYIFKFALASSIATILIFSGFTFRNGIVKADKTLDAKFLSLARNIKFPEAIIKSQEIANKKVGIAFTGLKDTLLKQNDLAVEGILGGYEKTGNYLPKPSLSSEKQKIKFLTREYKLFTKEIIQEISGSDIFFALKELKQTAGGGVVALAMNAKQIPLAFITIDKNLDKRFLENLSFTKQATKNYFTGIKILANTEISLPVPTIKIPEIKIPIDSIKLAIIKSQEIANQKTDVAFLNLKNSFVGQNELTAMGIIEGSKKIGFAFVNLKNNFIQQNELVAWGVANGYKNIGNEFVILREWSEGRILTAKTEISRLRLTMTESGHFVAQNLKNYFALAKEKINLLANIGRNIDITGGLIKIQRPVSNYSLGVPLVVKDYLVAQKQNFVLSINNYQLFIKQFGREILANALLVMSDFDQQNEIAANSIKDGIENNIQEGMVVVEKQTRSLFGGLKALTIYIGENIQKGAEFVLRPWLGDQPKNYLVNSKLQGVKLPAKEKVVEAWLQQPQTQQITQTTIVKQIDIQDLSALKLAIANLQNQLGKIQYYSPSNCSPSSNSVPTSPTYIGSSGLEISGNAVLTSLGVSGFAGIKDLGVGNSFAVGGSGGSNLTVDKDGNLKATNITGTGNLSIAGDVDINGNLSVNGVVSFSTTSIAMASTTMAALSVGTTTINNLLTVANNGDAIFQNTGQVYILPSGTTTIGSATSTPTVLTGYIASDIAPYYSNAYNLGTQVMDTTMDVAFNGVVQFDYLGYYNSLAHGDFNGDGYEDVLVSAKLADVGGTDKGQAYIFYGSATGPDNTADLTFTGVSNSDTMGTAVATGDINGDGFMDAIISAYGAAGGGTSRGQVYIYYGGTSMDNTADVSLSGLVNGDQMARSLAVADVNGDGYGDIVCGSWGVDSGGVFNSGGVNIFYGGASMDTVNDISLSPTTPEIDGYFGDTVVAGDVNGDGYTDIVVGSYHGNGNGADSGQVFVFYGSATGLDNIADLTISGEVADDHFGSALSLAGDVNGDGFVDIIVGAPYKNSNTGKAYIYYGGANMNNTADVIFSGAAAKDFLGESVATAGDVNGDGFDDVIIGSPRNNQWTMMNPECRAGQAHIYYGGVSMNNTADITFTDYLGTDPDYLCLDYFGRSVMGDVDFNNDGYTDIMVGANGAFVGDENGHGQAYIYYGSGSRWKSVFAQNFNASRGLQIGGLSLDQYNLINNSFFGMSTPNWEIDKSGNGSFQNLTIAATSTQATTSITQLLVSGNSILSGNLNVFSTSTLATTTATLLTISGNSTVAGNFGVGTTTPNYRLHVDGDTYFSGNSTTTGTMYVGGVLNTSGNLNVNMANMNLNSGNFDIQSGNINATSGNMTIASGNLLVNSGNIDLVGGNLTLDLNSNLYIKSLTQGSIPFIGSNGILTEDNSSLFWDDSSNRLGVGTTTSSFTLTNAGTFYTTGAAYFGSTLNISGTTTMATTSLTLLTVSGNGTVAGNFGIGTTTPSSKLSISGTAGSKLVDIGFTTGTSTLSIDGSGLLTFNLGDNSSTSMVIQEGGNNYLTFDTTNDAEKIVIGKDLETGTMNIDADSGAVQFVNMNITASSTVGTVQKLSIALDQQSILTVYGEADGNGMLQNMRVGIATSTPIAMFELAGNASTTGPLLRISTSTVEAMFIDAAGKIGIGTTSPSSRFTLAGTAGSNLLNLGFSTGTSTLSIDGSGLLTFNLGDNSSTSMVIQEGGNNYLTFDTTNDAEKIVVGKDLEIGRMNIDLDSGAVNFVDMAITSTSVTSTVNSLSIALDGNPVLTAYGESTGHSGILQNMRVGIGTTTPTALLSLAGNTYATGPILRISSSTVEAMFIDSDGKIGIGTTSPSSRFTLAGTAGSNLLNLGFSSGTSTLLIDGSGLLTFNLGDNSSTSMVIQENGNNYLTFDTTNDAEKIVVGKNLEVGQMNIDPDSGGVTFADMAITATAATGTANNLSIGLDGQAILTVYGENAGYGTLQNTRVGIGTTTPTAMFSIVGNASTTGGLLRISTSTVEAFFIDGMGLVGIGTTSPVAMLSVRGGANATAPLFRLSSSTVEAFYVDAAGKIGMGTTSPSSRFTLAGTAGSNLLNLGFSSGTSTLSIDGSGLLTFNLGDNSSTSLAIQEGGNNYLTFDTTNDAEKIVVGKDLEIGTMNIDADSGAVRFANMTVSASAATGTAESLSVGIDGLDILTVYAEAMGNGLIQNRRVGIGTSTPIAILDIIGNASTTGALMRVATSTGDKFFIDGMGMVGIGTTTPLAALEIYGTAGPAQLRISTSTGWAQFYVDNSGYLNIETQNSATSAIQITNSSVVFNQPLNLNMAGDLGLSYDLMFDNPSASYIKFAGNGFIQTESPFGNYNLTLAAANTGKIVLNDNVQITGTTQFVASSTVQDLATSSSILQEVTLTKIYASSSLILGSAPTIADGNEGDIIVLMGASSTQAIIVQDQDTLASSNLQLGSTNRIIANGSTLALMFDGTDWVELWYSGITHADFAEMYKIKEDVQAGDVVAFSDEYLKTRKASLPDQTTAGIISASPAYLIGNEFKNEMVMPVALNGRVSVKISLEAGAIAKGDLLILSTKSGYAMKYNEAYLMELKALGALKDSTSSEMLKYKNMEMAPIVGVALEDYATSAEKIQPEFLQIEYKKISLQFKSGVEESAKNTILAKYKINANNEIRANYIENLQKEEAIASIIIEGSRIERIANPDYSSDKDDKIMVMVKSGYVKVGVSSGFSKLTVIEKDGKLVFAPEDKNFADNLDMVVEADGSLVVGKLKAKQAEIGTTEKPAGITIYDVATGEPYCIRVEAGIMKNLPGKCEDISSSQNIETPNVNISTSPNVNILPPQNIETPNVDTSPSPNPETPNIETSTSPNPETPTSQNVETSNVDNSPSPNIDISPSPTPETPPAE